MGRLIDADKLKADLEKAISKNEDMDCLDFLRVASFIDAQRTGCSMCGFGIHIEKRPHRFDLLYESNPKEWDYLMFHLCKDKDGNDYGWAKVLDYIGVGWEPSTIGGNCKGQMNLKDFMK